MLKLSVLVILHLMLAQALAEPSLRQQRMQVGNKRVGFVGQNPYIVLSLSRGRSNVLVQDNAIDGNEQNTNEAAGAISYINDRDLVHSVNVDDDDDDDDDDGHDDGDYASNDNDEPVILGARHTINMNDEDEMYEDDDTDDNSDAPVRPNQVHNIIKNAKPTHMMVAREHTGAIMVPDGVIEIEGQSIIDEKTGKSTLLVPRAALDAIPDGSVVALMEPSSGGATMTSDEEEERANRVIVRRRRKGGRRNVRTQRRGGNKGNRRGSGNRRRRVSNRHTNVRVVQGNRRRNNRRRAGSVVARPILIQG